MHGVAHGLQAAHLLPLKPVGAVEALNPAHAVDRDDFWPQVSVLRSKCHERGRRHDDCQGAHIPGSEKRVSASRGEAQDLQRHATRSYSSVTKWPGQDPDGQPRALTSPSLLYSSWKSALMSLRTKSAKPLRAVLL